MVVAHLVREIEEAGVAIYTLVHDHLIIPGAAPLVLGVFASDLLAFQTAVERAEHLGVYAPFVRFLDLADANL